MIDEKILIEIVREGNIGGIFTDELISVIEEQPKIGGWIPCRDRLPEIEKDVLLSLRSLDVATGYKADTEGYFYVDGWGYALIENVLAWMPLPEPYNE